ncbi:MAG TPA: zinc-binding dehydrogenase [Clostridiales bacterium]|jgi:propanol-preferring alcohol dehydrogenase|nr:zinc-binding dehydrogenase [Clostridiales bacterium]
MANFTRGWEFTGTNEPLNFVKKDLKPLDEGYVRIKVHHAGLCSSDVGALHDPSWMALITVPCILGHEIAGEVLELGKNVEGWKIGDRVAICPMPYNGAYGPGYGRDGGYGTITSAHSSMLIKVPDNVTSDQAAASTDAGMTSYHAVAVKGGAKKGVKVGIIGLGGLGTVGMDVAISKGAEVYVATRKAAAQQKAREHGAFKVASNIKEFKDDQLDVIIDFAGAGITTRDAMETVKPGGKVVLVGMHNLEIPVNGSELILRDVRLEGSMGGTKEDIADVIQLISEGKLKIGVELIPLSAVGDGLKRLEGGEADDRLVMYTTEEDFK